MNIRFARGARESLLGGSSIKPRSEKTAPRPARFVFFCASVYPNEFGTRLRKKIPPALAGGGFRFRFHWSGRQDLNLRPHAPQTCALPGCATSRTVHQGLKL